MTPLSLLDQEPLLLDPVGGSVPRHQNGQQHQPNERTAAAQPPSDLMGRDRQRGLIRVVFSVAMPVSNAITLACLVVRFPPRDAAEDHQRRDSRWSEWS